jgi:hypothetical protein
MKTFTQALNTSLFSILTIAAFSLPVEARSFDTGVELTSSQLANNCQSQGGKLSVGSSDKNGRVISETCTKRHLTVTCHFVPGHPQETICSGTTSKAVRTLLGARGSSKAPLQDLGNRSGGAGAQVTTTSTTTTNTTGPLSIPSSPRGVSDCHCN